MVAWRIYAPMAETASGHPTYQGTSLAAELPGSETPYELGRWYRWAPRRIKVYIYRGRRIRRSCAGTVVAKHTLPAAKCGCLADYARQTVAVIPPFALPALPLVD